MCFFSVMSDTLEESKKVEGGGGGVGRLFYCTGFFLHHHLSFYVSGPCTTLNLSVQPRN